jgi:C4-dicarboxylate-specific signal transduction histidine kinase
MDHKEIAVIGRISAAMTHEMRNVLAIIRESSGLMQDILALSDESAFAHRDKFANALGKIEKHVRRGDDIVTQFNAFAHSMDEPLDWVEVTEVMERVAALMQRTARSKQVTLSAETGEGAPSVYTNPIRLTLALAVCVEHWVDQGEPGDAIVLRPDKEKEKAVIEVLVKKATGEAASAPPDLADVSDVLKTLGGDVQSLAEGDHGGVRLFLPLKQESV